MTGTLGEGGVGNKLTALRWMPGRWSPATNRTRHERHFTAEVTGEHRGSLGEPPRAPRWSWFSGAMTDRFSER